MNNFRGAWITSNEAILYGREFRSELLKFINTPG
jgi:hypothetical protein